MTDAARFAIVTPYYRETRETLERCIESVKHQSVASDHFVVSDGHPQDWLDGAGVRHLRLGVAHDDFGNTPRGIGALLAISEGYDGIGMLDADNWLEPDHVEACQAAAGASWVDCDYVVARRTFRRLDMSIMPLKEETGHVDTNCFFFLRGSFCAIPYWATMPKNLAAVGDRYFWAMMRDQPFTQVQVSHATVNYVCVWGSAYRSIGETPPPGAKRNIGGIELPEWVRSLSGREREIAERLTGTSLSALPEVSRLVDPY
jgi:hypothetical protein